MNQPEAYIRPFPAEPPSSLPLHPTLLGCQSIRLSSLLTHSKFPLTVYFTCGDAYVSTLLSQFVLPSNLIIF